MTTAKICAAAGASSDSFFTLTLRDRNTHGVGPQTKQTVSRLTRVTIDAASGGATPI